MSDMASERAGDDRCEHGLTTGRPGDSDERCLECGRYVGVTAAESILRRLFAEVDIVVNDGGYLVVPSDDPEFGSTCVDISGDEMALVKRLVGPETT